jgi:hypothetical protein
MTANHDAVLLAKYGTGWRWWPNPASRQTGSQHWAVPSVDRWNVATSPEDARSQAAAYASPTPTDRPQEPRNMPTPTGCPQSRSKPLRDRPASVRSLSSTAIELTP